MHKELFRTSSRSDYRDASGAGYNAVDSVCFGSRDVVHRSSSGFCLSMNVRVYLVCFLDRRFLHLSLLPVKLAEDLPELDKWIQSKRNGFDEQPCPIT